MLLQRTLLTGRKEPNVAANQLATAAVDQESDSLDREISNLKTELELRRTLANNSPMAIIQRHGTRAAGSRVSTRATPCRIASTSCSGSIREARHEPDLAALLAVQSGVAKMLLWTVLLLAAAVAANIAGIHYLGSVAGWERWLAEASGYFLLWRLCLYGATVYGWVWMRRRLLARESGTEARRRLLRAEVAGVAGIVARGQPADAGGVAGGWHMTLFTTDYLEYYLTLLGWIIHNGIWAVLVSSGVFAIPFVAIIIQEWLRARSEGADGE